jgi:glycerol-3-phosphate dehydrogenase
MAVTLSDIVFRRFPTGPAPRLDHAMLEEVAGVAAAELGWSVQRQAAEIKEVLRQTTTGARVLEPVA